MSVNNLLVAYSNSEAAQKALDVALVMQQKFDTHVTGLVAREFPPMGNQMDGWIPKAIKQSILDSEKQVYEAIEATWKTTTESRCVADKTHWIETKGDINAMLITYARYFDMTIMGQALKSEQELPMASSPDVFALQSGRPVMIVPRDFTRGPISERAVVAWDGKRAAARALADAMQFLEQISEVTILLVGDANPHEKELKIDIATHLSRHGLTAEYVRIKTSRNSHNAVGEAIVDYCEKTRPDVLIMGAYEHSKFREDFLGGVTNTIFNAATIPVFLSH